MAKKYNCTINGIQHFRKTKVIGHDSKGRPIRKNFYGDSEEDETDEEGYDIQVFNDDEMKIIGDKLLYQYNKDNTFNVAVQLDFIIGLRLRELLGMKKKFIIKYIAKVRNTLKRVKVYDSPEKWHRETKLIKPKSKSSIRNVNFPIRFWDTLELYLKEQEAKWTKI